MKGSGMFTHVMVGSNNMKKSKHFYNAVLETLGYTMNELDDRIFFMGEHGIFAVGAPINKEAATFANGGTIGFAARQKEHVDRFHAAGCASGGTCDGPPGPRQKARGDIYAAYLRDPDGNKICAIAPLVA